MPRFSFAKKERLKSRKKIEALFASGQHLFQYPIKLVYGTTEKEESPVLFTVSVSKRYFKKAVHRNRIKRLVREAYRVNAIPLKEKWKEKDHTLCLMAIYVAKEELGIEIIEKSLIRLMKKLE